MKSLIDPSDIKNTWDTSIQLGGLGLGWGKAVAQPVVGNADPNSPSFGLDCLSLRYAGPQRPAMVGQMVRAGVALKQWITPPAWEVWWTINGRRFQLQSAKSGPLVFEFAVQGESSAGETSAYSA